MAPERNEKVPEMRVFAERLKHHRELKGWSQEKLCEMTGISSTLMSQYERQLSVPKVDTARRLADALGVSVDYLVGRTNMYLVEYPRETEQLGEVWGSKMLETMYRAKDIPPEDRKVISDLIQAWVKRAREKNSTEKDDKEK